MSTYKYYTMVSDPMGIYNGSAIRYKCVTASIVNNWRREVYQIFDLIGWRHGEWCDIPLSKQEINDLIPMTEEEIFLLEL